MGSKSEADPILPGRGVSSRRSAKNLRSLASIFEEVDQSGIPTPEASQAKPDVPARTPTDLRLSDTSAPFENPSSLLDDQKEDALQEDGNGDSLLIIPPELEAIVTPDLWRKLNSPQPSRRILINALERTRSVLNLLSNFLPHHLAQEKIRRAVAGLVSGQVIQGTLLFADVSGFTALSESLQSLGPTGAERLTTLMNQYFSQMLEIIAWSGGTLMKFGGDATLVYFPEQHKNNQSNWAVRAGQRMLNAMAVFSNLDTNTAPSSSATLTLSMKIGIATGPFMAASVGSPARMEYILLGQAVEQALGAESAASGPGQLIVSEATLPDLDPNIAYSPHLPGFYQIGLPKAGDLDDFEIRADSRRARAGMPWSASPRAIGAQIQIALRQIEAIRPYLPFEVVERVVAHDQQNIFISQYRPTTVLFCNFWGLENLLITWGNSGTRRVVSLLNAYFLTMNDCVTRYGGIISQIDPDKQGNKLLILFGTPVAHEDDPERALNAALAMNAALDQLNALWQKKFARHLPPGSSAPLLQHRMGMTSGYTFAGLVGSATRCGYTVMGDDVNLAARLMNAAEPGQILLHLEPEAYEKVSTTFLLSSLPPIRLKGKNKPVTVLQAQAPRENYLMERARQRGPLIGRTAELARADAILAQAQAGHGAILALQGSAGIGKSHFADSLLIRAEAQGMRLIALPCRSFASHTPYACCSTLLRVLAGITTSDYQPEVHAQKLARLLQAHALPHLYTRPLATMMGLKIPALPVPFQPVDASPGKDETDQMIDQIRAGQGRRRTSHLALWDQLEDSQASETGQVWQTVPAEFTATEQDLLYSAVTEILRGISQNTPLLLFFEDAHWMDSRSMDLLQYLQARIGSLALLVLLSRRESGEPLPGEGFQILSLSSLNLSETTGLVTQLLVLDLAHLIHDQSSGNPLLIEEITRYFQRTRNFHPDELRDVLQSSNFLQKMILSGVENLPREQQEILLIASVIGYSFHTGALQSLLPATIDSVTLSNHLRALDRAGQISLSESGADARYIFLHGLVRDILYNSLLPDKRRQLHEKLAEYLSHPANRRRVLQTRLASALEGISPLDAIQDAETTAYHYQRAEHGMAAAQHYRLAANLARQQQAIERATANYSNALTCLESGPGESRDPEQLAFKAKIFQEQGDLAVWNNNFVAASIAYEAGCAVTLSENQANLAFALNYRLALVLPTQRKAPQGETWLHTLLSRQGTHLSAPVLAAMAWLNIRSGKGNGQPWLDECNHLLQTSIDHRQALQPLLCDLLGEEDTARAGYLAAGQSAEAALVSIHRGERAFHQGKHQEAKQRFETVLVDCLPDNQKNAYCLALAQYHLAKIQWQMDCPETARQILNAASAQLDHACPVYVPDGKSAIQQAHKILDRGSAPYWPEWHFQNFEDSLRIQLLLREFNS